MRTIALADKRGFSQVELMISLVLLLLVFLALAQTALVSIDSNMTNILRDEAVSVAEMKMNEARSTGFDTLLAGTTTETVNRDFRSITNFQFTATRTVTDLPPTNPNNKQIDIMVTWNWKGNPYTHSITTIVRKP
jgi:type IV pilus assembly protein PilV